MRQVRFRRQAQHSAWVPQAKKPPLALAVSAHAKNCADHGWAAGKLCWGLFGRATTAAELLAHFDGGARSAGMVLGRFGGSLFRC